MVYRLYFHPLARYPGPFLAKIRDMYGAWHSMIGRLHIETENGYQKYGTLSPFHLLENEHDKDFAHWDFPS